MILVVSTTLIVAYIKMKTNLEKSQLVSKEMKIAVFCFISIHMIVGSLRLLTEFMHEFQVAAVTFSIAYVSTTIGLPVFVILSNQNIKAKVFLR